VEELAFMLLSRDIILIKKIKISLVGTWVTLCYLLQRLSQGWTNIRRRIARET